MEDPRIHEEAALVAASRRAAFGALARSLASSPPGTAPLPVSVRALIAGHSGVAHRPYPAIRRLAREVRTSTPGTAGRPA